MNNILSLKSTEHSYYCSDSNYYVNGYENFGRSDYDTWENFKEEWLDSGTSLDDDYNHLFRFDICEKEAVPGSFELRLFFILQRKGIFRPVFIENIAKGDMAEIELFLKERWEYMKNQWAEFSTTEVTP